MSKLKINSGFAPILAVLILGLVGLVAYLVLKQQTPSLYPSPTPTQTPDPIANWKTYNDSTYGFSIRYPPGWIYKNGCEGGTDVYPCFHTSDFKVGPAGVLFGNPIAGGEIILGVKENQNSPLACPENRYGYKFPCSQIKLGNIEGWHSIVEGSLETPSYPFAGNTIYFWFLHNNKQFMFTGYYNDESREEIQEVFDQILSTFQFTN